MAQIIPDWIAVDWGTSNLRAWALGDGAILDHASSGEGMGTLSRDDYEPALLRLINGWLPRGKATEVIACGMVGSRQGWVEAPYRAVPCTPLDHGGLMPVHGTSYIQIVGFDDKGPVADAILSYSQSTNPASPHAADQTRAYAAKQWHRLPWHSEAIAKTGVDPHPLNRSEFAAHLQRELERWGPVIRSRNIRPD